MTWYMGDGIFYLTRVFLRPILGPCITQYLGLGQFPIFVTSKLLYLLCNSCFLKWAIPGPFYFRLFSISIVQLVGKILPMTGFEPWISSV